MWKTASEEFSLAERVCRRLAAQAQATPVAYQIPYVKVLEQQVYFWLCILILHSSFGLKEKLNISIVKTMQSSLAIMQMFFSKVIPPEYIIGKIIIIIMQHHTPTLYRISSHTHIFPKTTPSSRGEDKSCTLSLGAKSPRTGQQKWEQSHPAKSLQTQPRCGHCARWHPTTASLMEMMTASNLWI